MLCRLEVEKLVEDQVSLESKGLAIFTVGFCFALKMILERLTKQFRAPVAGQSNGGWILIVMFCSMTMLIPLLYG